MKCNQQKASSREVQRKQLRHISRSQLVVKQSHLMVQEDDRMPYCKRCGAQVPEDANFCPKCGASVTAVEAKPAETHQIFKVTGKPKVMVTHTAPGFVDIKTGPQGQVTVDMDLKVPEDLDCSASQEGNTITVICRFRTHVFHWASYFLWRGPRADITVSVPQETDLDMETRLDQAEIKGVKGNIIATSSVAKLNIQDCEGAIKAVAKIGSINLRNVNGVISVRSSVGSVDLENVNGTVSVHNSTGSIRFSGALSKGENWFRTSTGSIDLTLSGEPDLTVEASTRLGRITCTPELTNARYERGLYTGQVGAGTGRLIAEATTGSIVIRR